MMLSDCNLTARLNELFQLIYKLREGFIENKKGSNRVKFRFGPFLVPTKESEPSFLAFS